MVIFLLRNALDTSGLDKVWKTFFEIFMEFMPPERLCGDLFSVGTQVKYYPENKYWYPCGRRLDPSNGGAISKMAKIECRLAAEAWVGNPSLKTHTRPILQ